MKLRLRYFASVREALGQVADPRFQPSLEAWLRVHASVSEYALYFRDASLERREFDGSGLHQLPSRATQPLRIIPPGAAASAPEAAAVTGQTIPFTGPAGSRDRNDGSG